jgi:dolichol-phosphate mannosyltransferase
MTPNDPSSAPKAADVSVVFPAYNESKNIAELIRRVNDSFSGSGATLEMIVVDDDSPDGTAAVVESLTKKYGNLKLVVRKGERGLATAVVRGWETASGKYLAVMDSDLQHPPDLVFRLYRAAVERGADMVVASRRVEGGGTGDWALHRVFISNAANWIAKFFLPRSLFRITDTTTGCFLFEGGRADLQKLSPHGFKIFLEVLVRGKFSKTTEVGYVFNTRSRGTSKMTLKQDFEFIYHLLKLGLVTGEAVVPAGLLVLAAVAGYKLLTR